MGTGLPDTRNMYESGVIPAERMATSIVEPGGTSTEPSCKDILAIGPPTASDV